MTLQKGIRTVFRHQTVTYSPLSITQFLIIKKNKQILFRKIGVIELVVVNRQKTIIIFLACLFDMANCFGKKKHG